MTKPAVDRAQPAQQSETVQTDDGDARLRLRIEDLIPGRGGEIVLFNDSALRELVLETGTPPVETGEVAAHVTAEGVDVSGYRYLRFSDDLILFHDVDTNVVIDIATD